MQRYVGCLQEVFPKMDFVTPDRFRIETTNFSSYVAGYSHVGNLRTEDKGKVIILSVKLQRDSSVENARSAQRNYIKRLIENSGSDAAIVAFYTDGQSKWRLSFVHMSLKLKVENGALRQVDETTPAKRYSFLVGKSEPCNTAITRLSALISSKGTVSLEEIENAFSVDRVTDEFFKLYCLNYKRLYKYLRTNEEFLKEASRCGFSISQFAKKLMSQIVFLYFLQKKGWLGVASGNQWGTGKEDFVAELFRKAVDNGENFYECYLEPLFYQALNVNRGNDCYCELFDCKIPFLSGGLFEPLNGYAWKECSIAVPNEIFSNHREGDIYSGDGILDVFGQYNFTMSEDEPLEREIAIDPEMLGKVFERLLDIDERKKRATYYTPQEIVHYMVQETIINYLVKKSGIPQEAIKKLITFGDTFVEEDLTKIANNDFDLSIPKEIVNLNTGLNLCSALDRYLSEFRLVDICVGSGAFILGAQNEIFKARKCLFSYIYKMPMTYSQCYSLKRHILKENIFACDVDPCAVDISKLRLWLALIIEDACINNENPHPLPNLEYNIVCGDSIADSSFISGTKLNHSKFSNADFGKLISLQHRLYDEHNWEKANALRKAIRDSYHELICKELSRSQQQSYLKSIVDDSEPITEWLFRFPEIIMNGGFDAVIGNPPYMNTEEMHSNFSKEMFDYYKNGFESSYKQFDICFLFTEKAMKLLNKNGVLCYIIPNKFYKTDAGKMLRKLLGKHMIQMDDFGDMQLFLEKTIYSAIICCGKSSSKCMNYTNVTSLEKLWNDEDRDEIEIDTETLDENPWKLSTDIAFLKLLGRIAPYAKPLSKFADIFNGIQTSAERPPIYWFADDEIISDKSDVFVISKDGRSYAIEKKILHPYFKPTKANEKGMQTYSKLTTNKHIIFPYNQDGSLINIEVMKKDYKGTYEYLRDYYEYLVPKCLNNGKGRDVPKATDKTWYQYGRSQSLTAFVNTPKLIVRVLSKEPMYAYDNQDMLIASGGTAGYCAIAALKSSKYDLAYIQAWLNHPYTEKYLKMMGSDFENGFTARGTFSLKTVPFIPLDLGKPAQREIYQEVVKSAQLIYDLNADDTLPDATKNEKRDTLSAHIQEMITKVYELEFMQNEAKRK